MAQGKPIWLTSHPASTGPTNSLKMQCPELVFQLQLYLKKDLSQNVITIQRSFIKGVANLHHQSWMSNHWVMTVWSLGWDLDETEWKKVMRPNLCYSMGHEKGIKFNSSVWWKRNVNLSRRWLQKFGKNLIYILKQKI